MTTPANDQEAADAPDDAFRVHQSPNLQMMSPRRRPWGVLVAVVGFAIGAPFAFGAIKVPVPDAAKLSNTGGRAVPAGTISAAVPAGAVHAVPAGTIQASPCGITTQATIATPPPGTITRAQPAGTISRAQPAGGLPSQ